MKKSFLIHLDSLSILEKLPKEKCGELFLAIKEYQEKGKVDRGNYDPIIELIFDPFKNQFDRDQEKYQKICHRNKEIAVKRWEEKKSTKSTTRKPKVPKSTKSTDSVNDSDSENDNEKKDTTIVVPEAEEKKEYGDKDINFIIREIKKANNGIIDGKVKEQRQYGNLLKGKLNKLKLEGYTRKDVLVSMLGILGQNSHHSHKIAGPKKMYYELAGLMQICKQDTGKEKPIKSF